MPAHGHADHIGWSTVLGAWELRPGWTLFVVVLLVGYVAGLVRCRNVGVPAVSGARVASYVVGCVLLLVTVSSAIDVYAMSAFWIHMVEHLMLIMVVPAFLVLGSPLQVLRAATSTTRFGPRVERALVTGPVSVITHPLTGLGLYSAVIVGTHLSGFMDTMVAHPWLMDAEKVLYLASGYLVLLPLVGNEPIRWRLPHLGRLMLILVAMTPDTVVGIVLMQTLTDPFPTMEAARPAWAPAPMRDLDIAGAVMWAYGDGLMMLLGVGVIVAMIRRGGRENVLGARLENVRRSAMAAHVARVEVADGAGEPTTFAPQVDVDDDEAVLDAYNRMLQGLDRRR